MSTPEDINYFVFVFSAYSKSLPANFIVCIQYWRHKCPINSNVQCYKLTHCYPSIVDVSHYITRDHAFCEEKRDCVVPFGVRLSICPFLV